MTQFCAYVCWDGCMRVWVRVFELGVFGGSGGLRDYGESDHVIVMVRGDPTY